MLVAPPEMQAIAQGGAQCLTEAPWSTVELSSWSELMEHPRAMVWLRWELEVSPCYTSRRLGG
jgi:hypothetical protein